MTETISLVTADDIESLATAHYAGLYRFALSLSRSEADACDLTQHAFYMLAAKGHQLRDPGKAKTWLATTVYRQFLGNRRHATRFHHVSMEDAAMDLPSTPPATTETLDGATAMEALQRVSDTFRAPLALFYIEGRSYLEIAEILEVPIGTVMSRLSRGKAELRKLLTQAQVEPGAARKIIPMPPAAASEG